MQYRVLAYDEDRKEFQDKLGSIRFEAYLRAGEDEPKSGSSQWWEIHLRPLEG